MLLLCIVSTSVYAHTVNAQNTDIDLENVPITTFFKEIQQKSDFVIIYRDEVIVGTEKVTVTASSATLETVLTDVLAPLGLGYEIIDRQIIIDKKGPSIDDTGINTIKTPLQQTVNGTVTDSKGVPLPGANIVKKETTNGVTANFDGNFSLNLADENATLVVSYIGFATKEVDVNGQTTINVSLEESAAGLDEVVVIGYGTQKKSDLTGSVSSISSEDFNTGVNASVDQLMQGRAAGVQINQASGEPGGGISVRIRGSSSINAGNDPLYVIDGLPIDNSPSVSPGGVAGIGNIENNRNPLNALNPNDIQSIEILKDASATAIYGSRGANGVVLITTKKGKEGRAQGRGHNIVALTFPTDYPRPFPNASVYAAEKYYFDDFVNSFEEGDERKNLIVTEYTNTSGEFIQLLGNDMSLPLKYEFDPEASGATYGNDIPVIRFADILLSRAEALNEIGGPSQEIIDLVNQVRERAGVTLLSLSGFTKETLREHIFQERKWEFYEEAKRI